MKCLEPGSKCRECSATENLYASECTHIDPLCLTCGKALASQGYRCPQCKKPLEGLMRKFQLRLCREEDTQKFLAKLPDRVNPFTNTNINPTESLEKRKEVQFFDEMMKNDDWLFYKDETARKVRSKFFKDADAVVLENSKREAKWVGNKVATENIYMLQFQPDASNGLSKSLCIYPIEARYDFSLQSKCPIRSAEEIEAAVNARARWMKKHVTAKMQTNLTDVPELSGPEWDDEQPEGRRRRGDYDSDDEEDDDIPPEEFRMNEAQEFEEDLQDDEGLEDSTDSSESEEEEVPSDYSDEEEMTETGKETKRLLKESKQPNQAEDEVETHDKDEEEMMEARKEGKQPKQLEVETQNKIPPKKVVGTKRKEACEVTAEKNPKKCKKISQAEISLEAFKEELLKVLDKERPTNGKEIKKILPKYAKLVSQDDLKIAMREVMVKKNDHFFLK